METELDHWFPKKTFETLQYFKIKLNTKYEISENSILN
jgi:hypothetical protein